MERSIGQPFESDQLPARPESPEIDTNWPLPLRVLQVVSGDLGADDARIAKKICRNDRGCTFGRDRRSKRRNRAAYCWTSYELSPRCNHGRDRIVEVAPARRLLREMTDAG
jgi:hypothetical protein